MGYIAPITQYQYRQYHDRVEAQMKSRAQGKAPGLVTEVQKANNQTKFDKMVEERIYAPYQQAIKKEAKHVRKDNERNIHPFLEAKLTGKGRNFSSYA